MRLQCRLFLVGRFVTNPQKMILTFTTTYLVTDDARVILYVRVCQVSMPGIAAHKRMQKVIVAFKNYPKNSIAF